MVERPCPLCGEPRHDGLKCCCAKAMREAKRERDALLELCAKIKRGKPPDWVSGLIDGCVQLGIAVERQVGGKA